MQKDDTQITPTTRSQRNLILWGDPSSNPVPGQVKDKLPIAWTADSVRAGDKNFTADHQKRSGADTSQTRARRANTWSSTAVYVPRIRLSE